MALAPWLDIATKPPSHLNKLKQMAEVRAPAILTGSYVNSDEVDIGEYKEVCLWFSLTAGSLTSFEYQVQQSFDKGVTWYNIGAESITVSVITDGQPYYTTPAGDVNWTKFIKCAGNRFRVRAKGTGTATGSSCTITITGVN